MPEPSRASRPIPLRSTASFRGSIIDRQRNREFLYESLGEYAFILICLTSDTVADYFDQPEPVGYQLPGGRWAEHTFDALVIMQSGRRITAAVRLIGGGFLEVRDTARISYECFVRRTPRLGFE